MRTIFLDMDGVVADFNRYAMSALDKTWYTHDWPEEDWKKIIKNQRLYSVLEKTPEADNLVSYCKFISETNNLKLKFLTAVPKKNDVPYAYYDKVIWASRYYPNIPVLFGPYSKDKWKHCNANDILIDDRPSNCVEWEAAGGKCILHEGDLRETITKLKEIL